MQRPRACKLCGSEYQPTSARQKYCQTCGKQGKYGKASCDYCGKVFNRQGNTTGRFCSRECWYGFNTQVEKRKKPCIICGEQFKPSYPEQEACSRACGQTWRNKKYARPLRTCPVCEKQFDNRHKQQITCSRACASKMRRTPRLFDACVVCGGPLPIDTFYGRRFCSRECRNQQVPVGSTRTNKGGYVLVKVGTGYPYPTSRNGWTLQHRYVMEQQLGRALLPTETVHHKNGDKADNRPENLELRNGKHGKGQRADDLLAEIERLRTENAQLRARLEGSSDGKDNEQSPARRG